MNFKKTLSAVVATCVAAAAVSVSASATLVVVDNPNPALTSATGMWMEKIYVPQENIDFGIDVFNMGSIKFTFTPESPEDFEGGTGGAVILSSGPSLSVDHNWPQQSFWGVYDEEHEIYGKDPEVEDTNPLQIVNEGDYIYSVTLAVDDTNCVMEDAYADPSAYVQISFSEWGTEVFTDIKVLSLEIFDKSGNLMIEFDENGNPVSSAAAAPAADETPAPAADDTPAPAPATGDVAAVAGIAIAAAGALIVAAKKRK